MIKTNVITVGDWVAALLYEKTHNFWEIAGSSGTKWAAPIDPNELESVHTFWLPVMAVEKNVVQVIIPSFRIQGRELNGWNHYSEKLDLYFYYCYLAPPALQGHLLASQVVPCEDCGWLCRQHCVNQAVNYTPDFIITHCKGKDS